MNVAILPFCGYVFGPILIFFFLPLIFYMLPMRISINSRIVEVPAHYVWYAAGACALWFAMALGVLLWPSRRRALVRSWPPDVLWMAFVLLSTAGSVTALVHNFFRVAPGLEEIVHQLAWAPAVAIALGILLLRDGTVGRDRRWTAYAAWALIALNMLVAIGQPIVLSTVGRASFNAIAILYAVTVLGGLRPRQIVIGLALVTIVVCAMAVKSYIREVAYDQWVYKRPAAGQFTAGAGMRLNKIQRAVAQVVAMAAAEPGSSPDAFNMRFLPAGGKFAAFGRAATTVLLRINKLGDLAYVIQVTPARVPFAGGVTYTPLASVLVPRALWPEKPEEAAGQYYGHRYGFISNTDAAQSYNLPVITEAWMNGGWAGVVLSSLFWGLLLRCAWVYWIGSSRAPGNVMIGMVVVASAVNQESNLSAITGGVVHALFLYWLIDLAVRHARERPITGVLTQRRAARA